MRFRKKKPRIKMVKEPLKFIGNVPYCSNCNSYIVKVTEHNGVSIYYCDICETWYKIEKEVNG
ncbi:MAG: hypothetical protein ACPLKS_08135, partial [Caldisericum exile]|uniref:hypothetical protein n=1 Tax=Caldisericum exile TaxID=693075 RepID=UPI003C7203F9